MKHRPYLWLALFILIPAFLLSMNAYAAKNASRDVNGSDTIVFGNVTTADTLESVKTLESFRTMDFFEGVTYFAKILSRRASGVLAATDTVQFRLVGSVDDSTFQNVSSTSEVVTVTGANITADKLYSITFYDVARFPYTRLEIYNLAAADSITVQPKAKVSFREVR